LLVKHEINKQTLCNKVPDMFKVSAVQYGFQQRL